MSTRINWGSWLKGQLISRKMTQASFARRINVRQKTVDNWVHKNISPRLMHAKEICRVLEIDMEELLNRALEAE